MGPYTMAAPSNSGCAANSRAYAVSVSCARLPAIEPHSEAVPRRRQAALSSSLSQHVSLLDLRVQNGVQATETQVLMPYTLNL